MFRAFILYIVTVLVLCACAAKQEAAAISLPDAVPVEKSATPVPDAVPVKKSTVPLPVTAEVRSALWPDADASMPVAFCPLYRDADGDGYGEMVSTRSQPCTDALPRGYVWKSGDCADNRSMQNPGMIETCNSVDDNCDGRVDEEGADGCRPYYRDEDYDGYGVGEPRCLCMSEGLFRAQEKGDCDDSNEKINPERKEICNNKDDNCNGIVDEGEDVLGCVDYFFDRDNDGFGVADNKKCLCRPEQYYRATKSGDCNDSNPTVYPGAQEISDSLDNNCNGIVDEPSGSPIIIREHR